MQIIELPNRESLINCLPDNSIGVELGVWKGVWSKSLAKKATELHLIDFWTTSNTLECKQETRERLRQEIVSGKVILHDDDLCNILPTFPDEYFDWVYVDASHFYSDVKRDLNLVYPKVKMNGYICGHDLVCAHRPQDWGTGVQRAVLEMVQDGRLQIIALTREFFTDWVGLKK